MRALLSVLILSGCAALSGGPAPTLPQQLVYKAHGDYAAALPIALQYKRLPTCGPTAPKPLCKDPAVMKQIQDADNKAFDALSKAQAATRAGDGLGGAAEANAASAAINEFVRQTAVLPKGTP